MGQYRESSYAPMAPLAGGALPITAGLLGWFDAADNASFDVASGPIATWRDRSANAYVATQTNPPERPSRVASVQNGKPGLSFVNANNSYMNATMPGNTFPVTVLFVATFFLNPGNYSSIIGTMTTAPIQQLQLRANAGNGILYAQVPAVGPIGNSSGPTFANDVVGQYSFTWAGNSDWSMRYNRAAFGNGNGVAPLAGGSAGTQIGSSNAFGQDTHNGYLFELIKYARVLTLPELVQLEDYLRVKWGTP